MMEEVGGHVVVEEGDTLWTLSCKLGVEWQHLQVANNLKDDIIYPGEVLKVPRGHEIWNFKAVKARIKGLAADANAKFFDVFPPPQDIDEYREKHRLLLNALRHVETSFIMPAPIGDGGLSIGPLQISTAYHTDAWWQASHNVKYEHCEEVEYAERTVINYWLRYCPWALEFGDWETLARTHNGGPCFWHHLSTTRYWRRVKSAMRRRGYIHGNPEIQSIALSSDSGMLPLFNTHIPFLLPMFENQAKLPSTFISRSGL